MIRSKRGLSGVIVTLITVLLAIIAVSIVWVVIANIIGDTSENVQKNIGMVVLDIKNNEISEVEGKAILTVKRLSGPGDITGIKALFETESGNTIEAEKALVIGEQQTLKVEIDFTPTTEYIKSVTIYPQNTLEGETYSGQSGASAVKKSPENLARNAGFEEWSDDCSRFNTALSECPNEFYMWTSSGEKNVYKESVNIRSGKYSAKIMGGEAATIKQTYSIGTELTPATNYVSTSWIMCPDVPENLGLFVRTRAQPIGTNVVGQNTPCDGNWHYLNVSWTSTMAGNIEGVVFGQFSGEYNIPTSYFYIDEPTTYKAIA